uniref:PIH1 N-terminal domain-containing protein n=1 Tax=Anopheles funestus TaxID=62324 RepID=A0A4Y0BJZ4_ANOFN
MNAAPDFGTAIRQNSSPKHDFPLQNGPTHPVEYQNYIGSGGGGGGGGGGVGVGVGMQNHQQQQQDLTIDGIPNNFPHRRSRASRTFKNPPQPHMCIKERTVDGKEVFINVLSWTRIANPDNPDAPIPLYGGMKVGKIPPGSPKAPPLVYAVMASPEVLKKAGRKCPDTPERMNLVDLMCEFVEAMNPSLHLSRKPEILKDRDLSGELKDVWSAVQACRDKGRSDNGPPENLVVYTEFGPDSAPSYEQTIQQHQQQQQQQHHHQLQYQQQYEQLPNSHEQQGGRFPLSVATSAQQQQQHYPYHHQQQSAINLNNHSNSSVLTSIEQQISTISVTDGPLNEGTTGSNGIAPTATNGSSNNDELLAKETESLKLSSSNGSSNGTVSKTNGITLPNADASVNPAPPMTSSSSPTVPQTSPTNSTPVLPAKEPTKSSSGHNFFPMFRSSKSSNSSSTSVAANSNSTGGNNGAANNAQLSSGTAPGGDKPSVNGGGGSESVASSNATSDNGTSEPPKATKTSSKKSGLNFFRRNKSTADGGSKKEPSTPTKQPPAAGVLPASISSATSGPATPAATGAASTGPEAKLQTLMDNDAISHGNHRGHQNHPYHLDSGSNGNGGSGDGAGNGGDILEASTATIAAK